ncbi:ribonuclease P protein component [Flavobacteriaceae bacterium MAR_2010_188]|nr:ribonuclease P protein component [Flavobacteriaceae bacterium MAR_2010_188]
MDFNFGRKERLKGKKLIEKLFREGKSVTSFPLKAIYLRTDFKDDTKIKAGFSVGKRNFKRAVDRNRIKRLMRESYRLDKASSFNNISASYALMILYLGKDGTDFESIEKKMKGVLAKLHERIAES